MVIEGDEIKRHVHVYLTIAGDGVAQAGSILQLGTTHPCIAPRIRSIGIHPIENRQFVERQLIRGGYLLLVVERCTPVADALFHRVFPSHILIGVQVLVDWRIGFLNLCTGGRLEGEMQVLGEIPSQREITIPQELLREGKRQVLILQTLQIALL